MVRSVSYLLLALLTFHAASAGIIPDDTLSSRAHEEKSVRSYRAFPELGPLPRYTPPVVNVPEDLVTDSIQEKRNRAHALLEEVLEKQRFLESLEAHSIVELPIGVVRAGAGFDYTILIDRLTLTRDGALMDVYVSLSLPQTGKRLAFHGEIPLSAQGGIAGSARVFLLGDHHIAIDGTQVLTIRETNTYVEFDCSGFLGVSIDADVEISRSLLVPSDSTAHRPLRVSFTTYTHSLNDILVRVQVSPFQVAGLKGFDFHCRNAWLDWSDISNPPGLFFPTGYDNPLGAAGLGNLWRGFYLEEIEVQLPPAFARRSPDRRVAVAGRSLIIDPQGITGEISARNVLNDGNMSGWDYTIDELGLVMAANKIVGFRLSGMISVPALRGSEGEAAVFGYDAYRSSDGQYTFAVDMAKELRLDLWAAKLTLSQGSTIAVREKNNRFYPMARLSGELSIEIGKKGPKPRFNALRFENMVINSEAPYFVPGTFAFGREGDRSSLSGFPVVFDNITIRTDDNYRVGLGFDMLVNISGRPDEESFAAKGRLTVWGIQSGEPIRDNHGEVVGFNRDAWTFDEVEVSTVRIDIRKPKVFEFTGDLRFFDDDNVFGDGFRGIVRGKMQSIDVQAQALFGRTETFRYWYADALVELKTGIPILPGALSAFGFGGGYYSNMKQTTEPLHNTLGRSLSGVNYIPEENTVGLRAIVLIGTPRPEAMRGDVSLEVVLNRHGGINSVTFTGNANFMSAAVTGTQQIRELAAAAVAGKLTEQLESLAKGQVFGSVRLHFDNVNDIFHGNLEIYVNVAGGIVRGVNERNKAGWAELHFSRDTWHILIGTPDQPLGLEVARLFKSKSYFMIGKDLPGSPPPPRQVTEILGDVDPDYMRDMNALESGMGIAFGLHFLVDTGDLRFLIFYGRFSAGTGIDFMLKDYGNGYHCAGMSGPIGIDGWYANGQAYAFVTGKIGVKVNLRFYKGTYDILNIGAAARFQAKGPNPFWMKGTVGGYYNILGGLVKGRCRFEVTVGKDCTPVGEQDLLDEVQMIAAISPAPSSHDVDVFTTPQVVFNIPVGEVLEIMDIENKRHSFRAVLDAFTLETDGYPINGTLEWNETRDVVALRPDNILPGSKNIRAFARLTFEEQINGSWQPARFQNNVVEETASTTFMTATAPDLIPANNIAHAYPLPGHVNFLPDEHHEGYIQLQTGQPYLFTDDETKKNVMVLHDVSTGQKVESEITYDRHNHRIRFNIPEGLRTATTYTLSLQTIPRTAFAVDKNVVHADRSLAVDDAAGMATYTEKRVEGDLLDGAEHAFFRTEIHTSAYRTFTSKMSSIALGSTVRLTSAPNIFRLEASLSGNETFHPTELGEEGQRLIHCEAILDNNPWYEQHVYPLLYRDYPLLGWMRVRRSSVESLGIPPLRDVYLNNPGRASAFGREALIYNVGETVAADFFDLRHQAVNYIADHPDAINDRLSALILQPVPHLRYGGYSLRVKYRIPGLDKETSSYTLELFNTIPDND